MSNLTKRQTEIMQFIKNYINEKQYSPSYREILHFFKFSSLGSVYRHIHVLKNKGLLDFEEHTPRSIRLAHNTPKKKQEDFLQIPYIGYIKAGFPLETFAKVDSISLPASWIKHADATYVLRVKGDDLQEEQILSGDFLIIEATQEVKDGEMALVLINDHDILLKRYYQDGAYIRLEANNPMYRPIMVRLENLAIQGVLIGLFRNYSG